MLIDCCVGRRTEARPIKAVFNDEDKKVMTVSNNAPVMVEQSGSTFKVSDTASDSPLRNCCVLDVAKSGNDFLAFQCLQIGFIAPPETEQD